MIKFFWKNRGSVSVFLVIILLPVMTAAALFVDAGKVSLGESVVASSADLALSTALTGYDQQLKDMYGLFATVQNTDDLFNRAEQYFMESMLMAEISEGEAESEAKKLVKMVQQGDGISDILNIQLESLDDFSITKRSGATLADAAILEKQIVEFMKYRAPINTGLGFLSALESFGTLKEQTELVEKRTEYYNVQGEVLSEAQKAWNHLAAYNGTKVGAEGGSAYLSEIAVSFNGYKEKIAGLADEDASKGTKPGYAKKTIMDLYDTQDYDDFESLSMTLAFSEGTLKMTQNGVVVPAAISHSTSWMANSMSDFNDAKEDFDDAITEYGSLAERYFGADGSSGLFGGSGKYYYGVNGEGAYKLQYLVQANRDNLYEDWVDAVTDIYDSYCSMVAAYDAVYEEMAATESEAEEETPSEGDADADDGTDDAASEPDFPYTNEEIVDMESDFSDCEDALKGKLNPTVGYGINYYTKRIEDSLAGAKAGFANNTTDTSGVNGDLAEMSRKIAGYRAELVTAKDHLTKAKDALSKLDTSIENLETAEEEWETSATSEKVAGTDMAKNDTAEIATLGEIYDPEKVQQLSTRVSKMEANLQAMIDTIDSHTFFDKKLTEINSYSKLEKLLEEKIGADALRNVAISESYLEEYVASQITGKYMGDKVDSAWGAEGDAQASFENEGPESFYQELRTKFDGAKSDETEMKLEDFEKANEELASEGKDNEDSKVSEPPKGKVEGLVDNDDEEHDIKKLGEKEGVDLPSEGKTDDSEKSKGSNDGSDVVGEAADNMPDFGTHLANFGADIIEKLYITEYIMSMFSFDTLEAEYKAKNENDSSSESTKNNDGESDQVEDDVTIYTLTKEPINSENNFAYAREVEYIIYGGGNGGNIAAAYASIFGIRLAFNLIYAFSSSELRNTALSIATPISAATMGVVPVPLIQAIIIIGFACCESGIDLAIMKSGEKVQLVKDDKTWVSSIRGIINKAKDTASDIIGEVVDSGVELVSNSLGEVLDMGVEELNEEIKSGIGNATSSLNSAIEDIYDEYITDTIELATTTITNTITNEIERIRLELKMNAEEIQFKADELAAENVDIVVEKIKSNLSNLKSSYSISQGVDEDMAELVGYAVDSIGGMLEGANSALKSDIQGFIGAMFSPAESVDSLLAQAEEDTAEIQGKIMGFTTGIRDKITGKVEELTGDIEDKASEWMNGKKEELKTKLSDKVSEGGDKAKKFLTDKANGAISSLQEKIPDDIMGGATSVGDKKDSTSLASYFTFGYSDYLRLFIIIGLYTGEEAVMLRTADVIQSNMMMKNEDSSYKLSESGVYLDLDVKVMVKPTLLPLPLFADLEYNHVEDANWYTLSYSDTRGY